MRDFVTAIGLALVMEGIFYALFPDKMKKVMLHVLAQPPAYLRSGGLVAAVAGVCIVWLIRH